MKRASDGGKGLGLISFCALFFFRYMFFLIIVISAGDWLKTSVFAGENLIIFHFEVSILCICCQQLLSPLLSLNRKVLVFYRLSPVVQPPFEHAVRHACSPACPLRPVLLRPCAAFNHRSPAFPTRKQGIDLRILK